MRGGLRRQSSRTPAVSRIGQQTWSVEARSAYMLANARTGLGWCRAGFWWAYRCAGAGSTHQCIDADVRPLRHIRGFRVAGRIARQKRRRRRHDLPFRRAAAAKLVSDDIQRRSVMPVLSKACEIIALPLSCPCAFGAECLARHGDDRPLATNRHEHFVEFCRLGRPEHS